MTKRVPHQIIGDSAIITYEVLIVYRRPYTDISTSPVHNPNRHPRAPRICSVCLNSLLVRSFTKNIPLDGVTLMC